MRAVSTVLDVAVFLLLVSAAVGTLVVAGPPEENDTRADETVEVLASSTLSVEYDLRGQTRRAHGTVGELLARGAVANATIDDEPLSTMDEEFFRTVSAETEDLLRAPNRTQIVARWTPYRGAPLSGSTTVGPDPPAGTDVHSATVTVSVPIPDSHRRATNRTETGYDGVARPVASAVADGLLPDNRVDASVFRETPAAIATTHRYETVADGTGTSVSDLLASGDIESAHRRVVDSLTRTFAADMRGRFDTPTAAAETVRTGRVRITVRRWDA